MMSEASDMNRYVPLNKLVISEKNVRVVSASKEADRELVASIASQGVLQNLVVIPSAKGKKEVVAGGRRLASLHYLANKGEIEQDCPVPCLEKSSDADLTEISLAENIHAAMHPADQFVAYSRLVDEGLSVEDIALRFGVAKALVAKRLALGKVAPKLLDRYRRDSFSLECLMAFTVCDDHKRQLACYKELSQSSLWPHTIKSWLLGEAYVLSKGIGKFVGKAAYLKAGGALSSDLFEDEIYLSDSALVEELAKQRLQREARKLRKNECWSWIEVIDGSGDAETDSVRLQPVLTGVPKKLKDKIAALEQETTELHDQCCEADWPEDLDAQYDALVEKQQTLEQERDKHYLAFSDEQKSYSGCVVGFDRDGKLTLTQGIARKKDIPQPNAKNGDGVSETIDGHDTPETQGATISQALRTDLGRYRQQAVKAALLDDPATAIDVLHYSLCQQILSGAYRRLGDLMDASFNRVSSESSREETDSPTASDALQAAESKLDTQWLAIEDDGERLAAFRALPQSMKNKLVTYCVAQSLQVGVRGANATQDALVDMLSVDFTGYWQPTKDNYLSRLSKPLLLTTFAPLRHKDWAAMYGDMKKSAVVESMHEWLTSTPKSNNDRAVTWMPSEF
ncbi:MAG: hypothetical protein COA75_03630 [Cellvibrionales bacterium]|nr:MAG: hypothetical protein COA75_03630 [Cellvibrionales bacterium]